MLFSKAMHPITLEALIYLAVNREWWDLNTVVTAIASASTVIQEAAATVDNEEDAEANGV